VHYYERALSATLVRNDAAAEHVLGALEVQAATPAKTLPVRRYLAKITFEMLALYANSMVYLDDFTNEGGATLIAKLDTGDDATRSSPDAAKRSATPHVRLMHRSAAERTSPAVQVVEDYKDVRLGHGDDCEGVAKEIETHFYSFQRADVTPANASPLLVAMHTFVRSNAYMPALQLGSVTNKKLDTASSALSDDDALAHTYAGRCAAPNPHAHPR